MSRRMKFDFSDFAELEERIIQQGVASYKEPRIRNSPFAIYVQNPIYGSSIRIPFPQPLNDIWKAIDLVSNDGEFDWEVADYDIEDVGVTREMLQNIGLEDIEGLNIFAEEVING